MRETYVVYNVETGEECWRGSGFPGDTERQGLSEDLAAAVIPPEAAYGGPTNLDVVKSYYCGLVDETAGNCRKLFKTSIPGQESTYADKEYEAKSWVEGQDPSFYPYMAAEAEIRGITMEEVQEEILAKANSIAPILAKVEAKRLDLKRKVREATNIGGIVEAAKIDWLLYLEAEPV